MDIKLFRARRQTHLQFSFFLLPAILSTCYSLSPPKLRKFHPLLFNANICYRYKNLRPKQKVKRFPNFQAGMACCCSCHYNFVADMNRAAGAASIAYKTHFSTLSIDKFPRTPKNPRLGFGFLFRRKDRLFKRQFGFIACAEIPKPFSPNIGLDSQPYELSQLSWIGPVPGDIAELEAYCRIFRAAERLHNSLMDTLCNPITGECKVSYSFPSENNPQLEDKIVSVLGCMVCLLNKEKEDVLSGRSSIVNSFRVKDASLIEDKLPPLSIFRGEMKRYCESLHVALEDFLTVDDDKRSLNVWRNLQRLKNVCYDSGFPRSDNNPCNTLFANWKPIYFSSENNESDPSGDSGVAFWSGGQVTEEGLNWLLEKGFKVIVDLREEIIRDDFYRARLDNAVLSGEIELIKLPVEIGRAPSKEQVEQFSALLMDTLRKPVYLHSKEGFRRTSAMISRWKQYMTHYKSQVDDAIQILDSTNGSASEFQTQVSSLTQNDDQINDTAFSVGIDPFKSQLPPCNIFSRKEMSNFFKSNKVSPLIYSKNKVIKLEDPLKSYNGTTQKTEIAKSNQEQGFVESKISNGFVGSYDRVRSPLTVNGTASYNTSSTAESDEGNESPGEEEVRETSLAMFDSDSLVPIDNNMCASETGVVRIQSRRKAEMFLVRTDGFSCSREKVMESSLAFTHPSTQQQLLMWKSQPKTVLLLKKLGQELMEEAKEVASYLYHQEKMNVLVEPEVHDIFARIPGFGFVQTFYSQDTSDLHERVDFVACLGGDGVILHASNLFRDAVPPVVSFNLGSLGFLTSHSFEDYRQDLKQVIYGSTLDGVYITLRMRLRCEIFRRGKAMPGKVFDVLNEIVVDRGSNPYLSKIECFEHDRLITKVQGDGVIVATPTGSTAYSTAAGGSMVHPNVPCMLFTPICPHSLSFRPVILPDSARLELKIPQDARSNAWVSFDGKRRQQLSRGDSIRICMSKHPLPTVNKYDQTGDWFRSLIRCLNWNERLDQKAL
ncbi:NAD kinase 2, chloroplastic [Impatiens glandulifera]|uniref:NAD kinase 2, chloroplastic n=1 Tax=Impatiens glandulifera TaxID=253017 RepID=UPI001FB09FFF|nr:NAD kinase 2, chloroplastic [Impatiens glandulifera]